jgi:signal transduction histidine kinase
LPLGGLHSAIWVMMFVVLSGETLLENRMEATITRSAACVALFFGTVPTPPEVIPAPAFILEMFVRMGLLIAVSSVVRRLREKSDQARSEVAILRAELALSEQRGSLAREIHDGVGNSLAAAVLRLELAARLRQKASAGETDPEWERGARSDETTQTLKEEAEALRQAMNAVRDWTFHTRSWATDADVVAEIERLARRTGMQVDITGAALLDSVSEPLKMTVLRIVQEALTNAAKHARESSKETRVAIALSLEKNILTTQITDNGPGFDLQAVRTGVGLASMRERATGLGGELLIASTIGSGTQITLRLPR